ncbi:MAG: long-chain N-acyl amino acid synthase [Planctomycetota bacterium]
MPLAEQHVDLSARTTADLEYKIAATREERASAFRLVYTSYLEAGLGEPNSRQMRVTPYHLLPTTEVFIATLDGEPLFTVSLVVDGELGLPMESVYAREVAQRRAQGIVLGEVCCLADRRSQFREFFPVFLRLCRLMVQYALKRGVAELLVAVHPRHVRFYRRFMSFEAISQQVAYPTVRNHPAVALSLNFKRVDEERPWNYETFFGQALPPELLEPQPITWSQCEYFRLAIDPSFAPVPLGSTDEFSGGRTAEPALSFA